MRHYARNIGDLAAATRGLDLLHRGAYDALLDAYYLTERPLPADTRECYLLADARSPAERRAVDAVLARFFTLQADGYHQKRCDAELERFSEKSEKARASAMLSVAARERSNVELRRVRMAAARAKGTHTKDEWSALVSTCGDRCVRCGTLGPVVRDHIVPVYQGGSDGLDNLQPLCASCNSSKGPESVDHRPRDWRANVERTLSERSTVVELPTTHDPRTIKPKVKTKGAVAASPLPGWLPIEAWSAFLDARTAMKAKPTERAKALLIDELAKLREQGHDPRAVLEQSTQRSWRGLFPVKHDARGNGKADHRTAFADAILGATPHEHRPDNADPRDISGEAERVA